VSTTSPYSNNVTGLANGSYGFTAVATDNQGTKGTSGVVNVTVSAVPTITLGSVQRMPDGSFQFRVSGGSSAQTCIIDACDTLPNWIGVFTNKFPTTNCAGCSFIDFLDPATTQNRHFYRSRVFP
jgi:hypothetical protein